MAISGYYFPRQTGLGVQLLCGGHGMYGATWGGRNINDPFARLYLPQAGGGNVRYAHQDILLQPGRLYVLPSGIKADYSCAESLQLLWIHFRLEFIPGVNYFNGREPAGIAVTAKTERAFIDLLDGLDGCAEGEMLSKHALLLQLLAGFVDDDSEALDPDAVRLLPFLKILGMAPARAFDLKSMARQAGLHPTYFSNLFKRTFGISPGKYHLQQRLFLAQNLLRTTDLTLDAIAERCGYNDAFFFARTFKRHIGQPPGKYRQSGFAG
jgi:AraC-like DNA-binding protein